MAASVTELVAGSLTPRKTSWPLMLNTALPALDPPGPEADFTNSASWFHWLMRNSNWLLRLALMKHPMSPRGTASGRAGSYGGP